MSVITLETDRLSKIVGGQQATPSTFDPRNASNAFEAQREAECKKKFGPDAFPPRRQRWHVYRTPDGWHRVRTSTRSPAAWL